jgi:hypothetical protein
LVIKVRREEEVICVEDWAEFPRLYRAEQMPIRAIARHLRISKNTVNHAVITDRPAKRESAPKSLVVDAVEVQPRELLRETPTMPGIVTAEPISWQRGMTVTGCVSIAVTLYATSGVAGCPALASASAPVSQTLFGDHVAASGSAGVGYALAFCALNASTSLLRMVLVPFGGVTIVLAATSVAAVIGLTAMLLLGHLHGADGVAWGLACSKALMAITTIVGAHGLRGRVV